MHARLLQVACQGRSQVLQSVEVSYGSCWGAMQDGVVCATVANCLICPTVAKCLICNAPFKRSFDGDCGEAPTLTLSSAHPVMLFCTALELPRTSMQFALEP